MKLLQINTVYKEKSTGRTTYELEGYLENKGWECYAAYSDGPNKNDKFIRLGGLNAHRIHSRLAKWFNLQGFFSPFSARKVIKYIKRIKPDVVHLRNLHDNYISIMPVLRYLANKQIPTVVTLHDFFLFTGGCCIHTDFECEKWITGQCGKCPQAKKESLFDFSKKVQKKKIQAFSHIKNLAIVGVSDWATNQVLRSNKLSHAITKTIYNWVDFENFHYQSVSKEEIFEGKVSNDDFVILGVATGWSKIKGLDDFIKLSKMIGENCKIVLVGYVPQIQLPSNIISIGTIKDVKKLAKCYSAADVFVSFSYRETFGKVIAEAMSCGCPAIVYDITACGEIVGSDCGYAIPLGNVVLANEKIKKIKNDGKDFYKENCYNRTRELFDLNKNALEYERLYNELCKRENQ